jgi:hypothetical protein
MHEIIPVDVFYQLGKEHPGTTFQLLSVGLQEKEDHLPQTFPTTKIIPLQDLGPEIDEILPVL